VTFVGPWNRPSVAQGSRCKRAGGVQLVLIGRGLGVVRLLWLCYYCVQVNEARNDNDGTRPPKQECGEGKAKTEACIPVAGSDDEAGRSGSSLSATNWVQRVTISEVEWIWVSETSRSTVLEPGRVQDWDRRGFREAKVAQALSALRQSRRRSSDTVCFSSMEPE
jgi:hypothetical protein